MIRPYEKPLKEKAGFLNLKGNLFDSAIMKTSVISEEFRKRYLSNPKDPNAFEGRAIVFDGPEDYHQRIDDPALEIDEHCMLFMRGAGPVGYPGGAEVVNMRPPGYLIKKGITALPCIGDGRQSGTSGSPSILNASPEAAAGGGLAILKTGDRVRIDLNKRTADILISKEEYRRSGAPRCRATAAIKYPGHQTPWQEIQRGMVDELSRRHGAEAGGQVPEDRQDQGHPARQSLTPCHVRLIRTCSSPSISASMTARQPHRHGLHAHAAGDAGPAARAHRALLRRARQGRRRR